MMQISDRETAEELVRSGAPGVTGIVSIFAATEDGHEPTRPLWGWEHLSCPRICLRFDDVDNPQDTRNVPPTLRDVERLVAWARTVDTGGLLFHCFLGVGRSTACAIAVLAETHGVDAVSLVEKIRPQMWPNRLVVKYADDVHGMGGKLVTALDTRCLAARQRLWLPGE